MDTHTTRRLNAWNSYLTGIQGALNRGHVDNAFRIALKSQDKVLLLKLMSLTRPCVSKLTLATQNVLFAALTNMLMRESYVSQVLPWIYNGIKEKAFPSLHPKVLQALRNRLFSLSATSNDVGVTAAKLYHELQGKDC